MRSRYSPRRCLLALREEPDAGGDLRVGEELAGERDHAFDEVGLDEGLADFAFAAGVAAHGAIGEQQRHAALRREVVEHVLDPGEVGVALAAGCRISSAGRPPACASHHSLMLNGGLAITKSARRSGCWSLVKVLAGSLPKLKSMPRMAMFIAARRQVVGLISWP